MKLFICLIILLFPVVCHANDDLIAATLILEAGTESDPRALQAVMNVIQARADYDPSKFDAVVLKRWQFSCWNPHTIDDKPLQPMIDEAKKNANWHRATRIVTLANANRLSNVVDGANHYFADYIDPPSWAKKMKFTVKIGHHLFYSGH